MIYFLILTLMLNKKFLWRIDLSGKTSLYIKIKKWTIVNYEHSGFPMNNYNALIIGKPTGMFCAFEAIKDTDRSFKVAINALVK